MTRHYLSLTQVAQRLGVATAAVANYRLPEPDVMVGRTRGWTEETIDEWNAQRPGRGNWGPHKKK